MLRLHGASVFDVETTPEIDLTVAQYDMYTVVLLDFGLGNTSRIRIAGSWIWLPCLVVPGPDAGAVTQLSYRNHCDCQDTDWSSLSIIASVWL